MTHLKVAVRVRPLSDRERETYSVPVVKVENDNNIAITNIKVPEQNAGDSRERVRRFTFDYCFNEDSTQDEIYSTVGSVIQDAIKKRYHSCVLAYGQSSSGKTHTMMGFSGDPGLTPRLCQNVLKYFQETALEHELENMNTTVSYLEIYNEKVRDLLRNTSDSSDFKILKVREHPKKGPYVQGLSEHPVTDSSSLSEWLRFGNSNRKVAATLSNPQSSRSHSVFTITSCGGTKLHLIDLAGSERASSRCNGTPRFREGANINKSLVALGNVISVLAEKSSKTKGCRKRFVPYRDSLLTWLLKDTLGGNSKTIMIATVSPSSSCYSETINTLRFGQRAKQIISQPFVNEDPKEKTIRELRAEILRLKELLFQNQSASNISTSTTDNCKCNCLTEISMEENNKNQKESEKLPEENDKDSINILAQNIGTPEKTQTTSRSKTEKILPLIEVKSVVKPKRNSLRRTFSVSGPTMERKPPKTFGSHETIASSKSTTRPINHLSLRRPSTDRIGLSKKPPDHPILLREAEKTSRTEIAKRSRSEIVAAVTQRLYAKAKKKDLPTEREEIKVEKEELPPPINNARLKLQELTKRALKAYRKRNVETQTESQPTQRVKEKSTDINDLRLTSNEVSDAETCITIQTKEIGVNCTLIEDAYKKAFVITRTCGTQCSHSSPGDTNNLSKPNSVTNNPLSFTKYLQNFTESKFEVANPCTANPIYTTSVNINVSHNYSSRSSRGDCTSEDSLEDTHKNVCFPTPDLISNHNSLEAHTVPTTSFNKSISENIKFANSEIFNEPLLTNDEFEEENNCPEITFAKCTITPKYTDSIQSIDISTAFAPEIHIIQEVSRCKPLTKTNVPQEKIENIINVPEKNSCDSIKIEETIVLKSIMKQNQSNVKDETDCSSITEPETEIPDSLNYHIANNKKVRFSKCKTVGNDRMVTAMSNFLEEATNLITNLTLVAAKMEKSTKHSFPEDYDVHITLEDISSLKNSISNESKTKDFASQTSFLPTLSTYTQTSLVKEDPTTSSIEDFEFPVNKYECLVEDSCRRLERCLDKCENLEKRSSENDFLHKFPQPFSITQEWNLRNAGHLGDDSSLESNPTFSDYGSLPRRKKYTHVRLDNSPSAFLRQLTTMRQDVVRSSREELCKLVNDHL